MKLYQKIMGVSLTTLALSGLTGCVIEPIEGIVKEEFGTAALLTDNKRPTLNNELIKSEDLNYGLVIKATNGAVYTLDIDNHYSKPILALAKAIEPGDRVKITPDASTVIKEDNIGTTDSDTVKIIEKNRDKPLY